MKCNEKKLWQQEIIAQNHEDASKLKKKMFLILIVAALILTCPELALSKSGFEFYLFGRKIESFQDCNWLKVTAGAVMSVLVHELGHALYLQHSGKQWDSRCSLSSGLTTRTPDELSDSQGRNLGRAGFTLQTLVGMTLTAIEKTRNSDFTKGWICMNAAQICTYKRRREDNTDDFALIDRRGGNGDLELGIFSLISLYNLRKLESDFLNLPIKNVQAHKRVLYSDLSEPSAYPVNIFRKERDVPMLNRSEPVIRLVERDVPMLNESEPVIRLVDLYHERGLIEKSSNGRRSTIGAINTFRPKISELPEKSNVRLKYLALKTEPDIRLVKIASTKR